MEETVVTGSGIMGLNIAQAFARNGYDTVVCNIKGRIIRVSGARLNKGLDKLVGKGKLDEAKKAEILSHMSFATELVAAADVDLVVEAAIKNPNIKKSIFMELDSLCKPEAILASNTSSTSITVIATTTKYPNKFIGIHFSSPTTAMKLVEVTRGAHTSNETHKTIAELAAAIDRKPVEVNEVPGFVVNRVLVPMIDEGIDLVYIGVASMEGMDTAMKLGANHLMGPLALGDLTGLDVCLAIMDTLYDGTYDPKHCASLLLRKTVRAGKLGRKISIGFYDYFRK